MHLVFCRLQLRTEDTAVGSELRAGKEQYVHSIQGGPSNAPVLICLPGYGAGAAFYFRHFPALCQHFKVYAVDLLGNGMSGVCKLALGTVTACSLAHCLQHVTMSLRHTLDLSSTQLLWMICRAM